MAGQLRAGHPFRFERFDDEQYGHANGDSLGKN